MLRSRRLLALTTAILALALLGPVVADAGRGKAGKWKGKADGTTVKFRLGKGGKKIKSFQAPTLTVYCFGISVGQGQLSNKLFYIPSIKVKRSGKFSKTYVTKGDDGQPDGNMKISGTFKGKRKVKGEIHYTRSQCYGNSKFAAKRK